MHDGRMSRLVLSLISSACILAAQAQPDSTAGDIYKRAAPSVVLIVGYNDQGKVGWTGTGFIVAADGKILTNYHVIRNSRQASVVLANGDAYDNVEVMDVDQRKDIALLKIKAVDLQPVRIGNSNAVQVGDRVYSVSNPLGSKDARNTLSEGIISGVRPMVGYRMLQTTAPISPGSSGGPLFNANGEVIGITAEAYEAGQSLNFAVPIDYARGILASPSAPMPLASVYNPEKPVGTPPPPSPPPPPEPKVTSARVPAPIPDEMRQNVGIFLEKKLHVWTEDDAQQYLGTPLSRRLAVDAAKNPSGYVYSYPDPTGLYQRLELVFDSNAPPRMTGVFMYPARMTWDDCKKVWGDSVNVVKNPDGTQFHNYKNRRLNVYLDKRNNVISLGLY